MDADRFLAVELDAHRPPGHSRQQRGLRLDRHVLLAAEPAAVRRELDVDPLLGLAEHGGDLPAIFEDALALAVDVQAAVGQRHGEAASGSRNRCSMRCVVHTPLTHMRGGGERRIDVAAANSA